MITGIAHWLKAINGLRVRRKNLLIDPTKIVDLVERGCLRNSISAIEIKSRIEFALYFEQLLNKNAPFEAIRVGRQGDGGYLVPPIHIDKVVSIGIGHETSFEFDAKIQESEIFMFDHTVEPPRGMRENMYFHEKGIGEISSRGILDFESIKILAGISNLDVNLLKVDVEGSEFSSLKNCDLSQFAVVIIELHYLEKMFYSSGFEDLKHLLGNLLANHSIFHVHANNWGKLFNIGQVVLPDIVEITFIREEVWSSFSDFGKSDQDYPCRGGYPEIWPIRV